MTEEIKTKGTCGGARPNSGGARPCAGRKKLEGDDAVTKQVQFRIPEEQAVTVKKIVKLLKAGEITLEDLEKVAAVKQQ